MNVAVLGAGSWGTALAVTLAKNGHNVVLYARDAKQAKTIQTTRVNTKYLSDIVLPQNITITNDFTTLVAADGLVSAVPSSATLGVLNQIQEFEQPKFLLGAAKGIEPTTGSLIHSLVADKLPSWNYSVLSGPSFAKELAMGKRTAVALASNDSKALAFWQAAFSCNNLFLQPGTDLIGVQLGGILKNIIAIAVGINETSEQSTNTRSALISLGLCEITELAVALGAETKTMLGLAGAGDLILTCSDNQSRNRRFGMALRDCKDLAAAEARVGQVVEGLKNLPLVCKLAQEHNVQMPIATSLLRLINGEIDTDEVIDGFFARI